MVKFQLKFMRQNSLFQGTNLLCRALKEGYVGIAIHFSVIPVNSCLVCFKQHYKLL